MQTRVTPEQRQAAKREIVQQVAGEQLCLRVALIRDLRRLVPVGPHLKDADLPWRWDADRERAAPRW